ncbi:MAG: polyphosphate kinase 1 [Myxococcota bacterium]
MSESPQSPWVEPTPGFAPRHVDGIRPVNRYINRELSWLRFDGRVLEEAMDPSNPLLERLRFLTIFHTNLDEFFMIRVAGIKQQIAAGIEVSSIDGFTPRTQLLRLNEAVEPLLVAAERCLTTELVPALANHGVEIVDWAALTAAERAWAGEYFAHKVFPMLTPLAIGPTHPFPFISNLSLNLGLMVRAPDGEERLARVKLPLANLPRLVPIGAPTPTRPPVRLVFVEQLVAAHLPVLFAGMDVSRPWAFRVTRAADLEIREDEADDLMATLQQELRRRRFGQAVRLEVERGTPDGIQEDLRHGLGLAAEDVVQVDGPMAVSGLTAPLAFDLPDLKFRPTVPRRPSGLEPDADLFALIRQRDWLLHHPFDSFAPVVEFVRNAARDPAVVAIKQLLYRTSGDSPVIRALEQAVENGKQVAAVVELKARFDEENNIVWARRLEEAGVHVIYGVPGLKTHAKLALVVRREGEDLVRYAHIGTGNYNPNTARLYTDLGLFTANPEITADVADLFNQITGFARPNGFRRLLVAPSRLKQSLLELIAFEAEQARGDRPARIVAKMNGLTDLQTIDALYDASRAGVQIDLLVRGICCLVPGVPGMSDKIRVRSVVGRFLEHERVYTFHHGGDPQVYVGSADWMERNLERRVEVLTPILDRSHASWLRDVLLERYLTDRARTREMQPDGTYVRLRTGPDDPDAQEQFLADRS